MRAYLDNYLDSTQFFACWSKAFPATQRNYWGGLQSDPVTLYANGVDGREDWMYMIVVVPTVNDQVQISSRSLTDLMLTCKLECHTLGCKIGTMFLCHTPRTMHFIFLTPSRGVIKTRRNHDKSSLFSTNRREHLDA